MAIGKRAWCDFAICTEKGISVNLDSNFGEKQLLSDILDFWEYFVAPEKVTSLPFLANLSVICRIGDYIESVDSVCSDGADMSMVHVHYKAYFTLTLALYAFLGT